MNIFRYWYIHIYSFIKIVVSGFLYKQEPKEVIKEREEKHKKVEEFYQELKNTKWKDVWKN